jgi:hypothetical protein
MSTVKKLAYSKHPNLEVISALRKWRQKTLIDDAHPQYLPASYLLSEEAIVKLASLSPSTESAIKGYLSQQWAFWTTYGPNITTIISSVASQSRCEKTIPSPATDHQPTRDKNARLGKGLGAAQSSSNAQYATQHSKRQRSHSPGPIDLPFTSTEPRQKRARHVVTNPPNSCNATVASSSWSLSQQSYGSYLPSSQPLSQPVVYSNNPTLSNLKAEATLAPPCPFPPPQLPVPSQYHLHSVQPNVPLGTLSPYQPGPSSQPVMSPSHSRRTPSTPLRALTHSLAHSQHIRHSNTPYYPTPIYDPAVTSSSLQLRAGTSTVAGHQWSPTSTPTPNTSQLHRQTFGISSPHSPFRSPLATVIASSSGGPHTATYQHHPALQFRESATPSEPPLPPSQYYQHVPPSGHAHPTIPHFGLFTPFPSPHPMVPPKENPKNRNFSFC